MIQLLRKGQVFKNPDLANTLRTIVKSGKKGFYEGEIVHIRIANFVQDQGGFLSYDDLKNHKSEWIEPVSTNYRGYRCMGVTSKWSRYSSSSNIKFIRRI